MEDPDPCMFEIFIYNADRFYWFVKSCALRHHTENSTNNKIDLNARLCRLVKLADYFLIRQGIHFGSDPCRVASYSVLYFGMDHFDQFPPDKTGTWKKGGTGF